MTPAVEVLHPSGGYRVSAVIDGRLVTRRYFGYTKREAVADFKRELAKTKKPA